MIYEYNRLKGVPEGCYYLERLVAISGWGAETTEITHYGSKEELEQFCKDKGWKTTGDWPEYRIKQHGHSDQGG